MNLALLLLAGCGPVAERPAAGRTGVPTGAIGSSGIPVAGTASGLPAGTPSGGQTTSPVPACYTFTRPVGAVQWTLAQVPDTDGPPIPVQLYNAGGAQTDRGGLAWFDGAWWACVSNRVTMYDPVTADVTALEQPCYGVFHFPPQLAVNIDSISEYEGVDWYDSTADLLQRTPSATTFEPWENNLKGVTDGTTLWAGAHQGSFLNVYELATGAHSELPLDSFDAGTEGIGMLDGTLRVLDDGRANPNYRIRVHSFDPGTGAHLGSVAVGDWGSDAIVGLWCGVP